MMLIIWKQKIFLFWYVIKILFVLIGLLWNKHKKIFFVSILFYLFYIMGNSLLPRWCQFNYKFYKVINAGSILICDINVIKNHFYIIFWYYSTPFIKKISWDTLISLERQWTQNIFIFFCIWFKLKYNRKNSSFKF